MAVKQMESALNGNAYVCVRSNSLFFWLPVDKLLYITSSRMLRDATIARKNPSDAPVALLEGHRIAVFSLRELLGCSGAEEELHAIILQLDGGLRGLLVDEVTDAIHTGQIAFLPLPNAVKSPQNAFLQGLIWMERRSALAYVMDPELLPAMADTKAGQAI